MATSVSAAPLHPGGRAPQPPLWRDSLFWLALALTVFAVAPFALPGYFWGANDARHHVYFLFEYERLVQDGIWWPRWSPDFAFGYGYPFFNIYAPFSHFLAAILRHFLAVGYTAAVESIFVVSIVASAAAMYAFVRAWIGRPAALVAAVAYTYVPYHLLNLYVRANLAESMALLWLPLILWTARESMLDRRYRWIVGLAVSYAGLMYTSNLVIALFTPLLAGYVLLLSVVYAVPEGIPAGALTWGRRLRLWWRRVWPPIVGGVAGLGLSAAFWLPMLLERRYVRVDQWFAGRYDFHGHFVYWHQFFSPQWGFGVSTEGPGDTISFQIGAGVLVLATLGVLLVWRQVGRLRWEIAWFALAAAVAALLASQAAAPLWDLPVIGGILQAAQFPWRWLVLTALGVSILAGLMGHPALVAEQRRLSLPAVVLASILILASYPYLQVQIQEPVEGPVSLASLMRFQQSSDEMTGSTAWVKEIPTWSPMADIYLTEERAGRPITPVASLLDYGIFDYKTLAADSVARTSISEEIYFFNGTDAPQTIIFNQFYYPGWNAYLLDGEHGRRVEQVPIVPEAAGTLGRMTVQAPPGEGYLLLTYEDTPPRTVGGIITISTLVILAIAGIGATLWRQRSERKQAD